MLYSPSMHLFWFEYDMQRTTRRTSLISQKHRLGEYMLDSVSQQIFFILFSFYIFEFFKVIQVMFVVPQSPTEALLLAKVSLHVLFDEKASHRESGFKSRVCFISPSSVKKMKEEGYWSLLVRWSFGRAVGNGSLFLTSLHVQAWGVMNLLVTVHSSVRLWWFSSFKLPGYNPIVRTLSVRPPVSLYSFSLFYIPLFKSVFGWMVRPWSPRCKVL